MLPCIGSSDNKFNDLDIISDASRTMIVDTTSPSIDAGKNKITGCFYDFSPAGDNEHPLIDWFAGESVPPSS